MLVLAMKIECVCELYFSVRIRARLGDGLPDGRSQQIAAENAKPGWRAVNRRFLYEAGDADPAPGFTRQGASGLDDAETFQIVGFDFPNRNNTPSGFLVYPNQLVSDRFTAHHDHIGEQNDERIVAHKRPRTGNGVGESPRLPLPNKLQLS